MNVGQLVYIRNFGKGDPWLKGVIQERTGPVSFRIKLENGQIIKRHQDHLRKRWSDCEEEDSTGYHSEETEGPQARSPLAVWENEEAHPAPSDEQDQFERADPGDQSNEEQSVSEATNATGNQQTESNPNESTDTEMAAPRRSTRVSKKPERLDL